MRERGNLVPFATEEGFFRQGAYKGGFMPETGEAAGRKGKRRGEKDRVLSNRRKRSEMLDKKVNFLRRKGLRTALECAKLWIEADRDRSNGRLQTVFLKMKGKGEERK
ncbi:MAG: hypothetical protein LUH41_05970 [Clostridiales bacterium]|nr:hypothetical protein [Clostridiales bacterium]